MRASVAQTAAFAGHLSLLAEAGHVLSGTLDIDVAVSRLARLVVPVLGDWSLVALADADGSLTDVGWWHARDDMAPVLNRLANERFVGLAGSGSTITAQRSQSQSSWILVRCKPGWLSWCRRRPEPRTNRWTQTSTACGRWRTATPCTACWSSPAMPAGRRSTPRNEISPTASQPARGTVLDNARLYTKQARIADALENANSQLREALRHDRVVSRALQDAMLTHLPEPDHLHVTARYLTADSHDQVGGDWYDALLPPDGATTLMIGDVAGHDIAAATVMGQLRNLLRAMTWDHEDETPSQILTRLDRAMPDLGLTTMTTAVLARIEQSPADAETGMRRLRWSCAGHPMPVIIDTEGCPRMLHAQADPPLGISRGLQRHDHETVIGPGQTLLLYTDRLVETRNDDLWGRYAKLLVTLASLAGRGLDDTLEALLAAMVGDAPEDDVAVIAVRFHPEDQPRPAEAGPSTD